MFYTTLNKIREHSPCRKGWEKLLTSLGKTKADDEPLSFKSILYSNGLDDAVWALRSIDAPEVRLFAVRCVRQIQHLISDERLLNALDVSEAYAVDAATEDELYAAHDEALEAEMEVARNVVRRAAPEAAWSAAQGVAQGVSRREAWVAAQEAAWSAAQGVARRVQEEDFIAIFCSED